MVCNKNRKPYLLRMAYLRKGSNSIVTGNYSVNSISLCLIHDIYIYPIAVLHPMRDYITDISSHAPKKVIKNKCRAYSINIIVSNYPNFLFFGCFFVNNFTSLYQIMHKFRACKFHLFCPYIPIYLLICLSSPVHQHPCSYLAYPKPLRYPIKISPKSPHVPTTNHMTPSYP